MEHTQSIEIGEEFPPEIRERLKSFHCQLSQLEVDMKVYMETPLDELHDKLSLLEKSKMNLIAVYTLNSLFWAYLVAKGENARDHAIKQELARIKNYMQRAKEIEQTIKDKAKAPKLNTKASRRIVKNALWSIPNCKGVEGTAATNQQTGDNGNATAGDTTTRAKKNLWKKAHQKQSSKGSQKADQVIPGSASVNKKRKVDTPNTRSNGERRKKKKW